MQRAFTHGATKPVYCSIRLCGDNDMPMSVSLLLMRIMAQFAKGRSLGKPRGAHIFFIPNRSLRRAGLPVAMALALLMPAQAQGRALPQPNDAHVQAVKKTMQALKRDNIASALAVANGMRHAATRRLLDWLICTSDIRNVPSALARRLLENAPHWPQQQAIAKCHELALVDEQADPKTLIARLGRKAPVSVEATRALVRAHQALGNADRAAQILRALWHQRKFSIREQAQIIEAFAPLLRAQDHKRRIAMLLYSERVNAALALAKRTNTNRMAITRAHGAVIRRQANAGRLLAAVPRAARGDASYQFARIRYLRRKHKYRAAINSMLRASIKANHLVDPDAWWIERRVLAREALELREPHLAYRLITGHQARSPAMRIDAEFHAGWIALRELNRPAIAARHFSRIIAIATKVRSRARGLYWLARAREAEGARQQALSLYARAATHATTYYGQLANARLGARHLSLGQSPAPDVAGFLSTQIGHAAQLLIAAGYKSKARVFFLHFAKASRSPRFLAGAAAYARQVGMNHTSLLVAKRALARGINLVEDAFPLPRLGRGRHFGKHSLSLLYGIARQESEFNAHAVSASGARGLMQLMPATARRAAGHARLPYSRARLTTDPAYNATLAAHHLKGLLSTYNGSYVKVLVAYNAGGRRVDDWVKRFADPEHKNIDTVDWIERIPFAETRNYVQRVLENVQVYGARLGSDPAAIATHLSRNIP